MKRRTFLATISTGTVAIAGCGTKSQPTPENNSTEASNPGESNSETTKYPNINPARSKMFGSLKISAGQAMAKRYIRYFDTESESMERLHPENDWWWLFTVRVKNLNPDGPDIQQPPKEDFKFYVDGQTFPVMTDFPRIDWGQVDLRESYESYWVEPRGWYAFFGLEGGEEDSAYFLADAKATTYPVVQVEYQGETVHLEENLIHTPTD